MIRRARLTDVQRILELGAKNHDRAHRRADYQPDAARSVVEAVINHGAAFLTDGGMIGGFISPFWASPEDVEAWELFWFAEDGRGLDLLDAWTAWAVEAGAKTICLTTFKRDSKALMRRGFVPSETIYRRAV